MNWFQRVRFMSRAWRYRLKDEEFGLSFLRSHNFENQTIVDIGANQGIFSYWMHLLVGSAGRVVAFEPQADMVRCLYDLKAAFGLNQLEIAPCGLSSQPGELVLRCPKGHSGGASFEWYSNRTEGIDTVTAEVTTLDRYFANHSARPIRFIKCDVEGHELQVFQGGQRLLTEDRPELLFECSHPGVPECPVFTYLQSLGYEGYCFLRRGFAPVSDYRSLRSQLPRFAKRDFVFVPREKHQALLRRCA
jgi:FkbM family methyltransferase